MQVCTTLDIDPNAGEARPVSATLQEVFELARLSGPEADRLILLLQKIRSIAAEGYNDVARPRRR